MGFDIDFLAVGGASRSGDAIALRYSNGWGGYDVMIVDGGDKAAGERLVSFVQGVYGTNSVANVLNSHPDGDHASGLSIVLEQLKVGRLWLHQPWDYASDILKLFHDGRITDDSLERRIREALQAAHDLEVIAKSRKIPIAEPYAGTMIGPFQVLSPDQDWYLTDLVPNFARTPEPKREAAFGDTLLKATTIVREAIYSVAEALGKETLGEDGVTSAQNEVSTIIYGNLEGHGVLLTGDAGIQALNRAHSFASSQGINLSQLSFMQVPHHGARRNVSPSILDKIMAKTAFVSAAEKDDDHPRRKVVNAFKRRGAKVFATKGINMWHPYGTGERSGYSPATELPFYDLVEEDGG